MIETRKTLLVFVVIAAVCTACGRVPAKAAEPPVSYDIISDKSVNGGQLREVWLRIKKPVSEKAVKGIAERVKATDRKRHPKTSIFVLLPSMEVGKGAWARAVFRPQLEVTIIGGTVGEHDAVMAQKAPSGETVGVWLRPLPGGATYTITITRADNGKCVATYTYPSGQSDPYDLVEVEPGRRYQKFKAQFGEFQVIDSDGNLELWDEHGRIETLQRVSR